MNEYERQVYFELTKWQHKMLRKPSYLNKLAKRVQTKLNTYIPEKIHKAITLTIKQMSRLVLLGAEYITDKQPVNGSLELKEAVIKERINFYKKTAAAEGGITGAGGILLGIADFPLLLGIKMKLLFDIAAMYGFDIKDYKERLYILFIFQLAFSSQETVQSIYKKLEEWPEQSKNLPEDINQFDWRSFQQEYRDYIDLAKMAQLVPIIGAPVGAVVNYRLIKKLGFTAMNAYRMRYFQMNMLEKKTTTAYLENK